MIYYLTNRKDLKKDDDPWIPWYDKSFEHVVIAKDEDEARLLASQNCGVGENNGDAWLDPKYSECIVLDPNSESRQILSDTADT